MVAVILTAHSLIVLALIGVVLLQRSDGGALGLGGGGGGFMTSRGAANTLTRTTTYLATAFFATSMALTFFGAGNKGDETAIQELTGEVSAPADIDPNAPPTTDDLLKSLGGDETTPADDSETLSQKVLDSLGKPQETAPVEETAPAQEGVQAEDAAETEAPAEDSSDRPDQPKP